MESGNTPAALYIDLSKAFDTLSFDILLYKLSHYGIKGNAFNLLKSYLTDRKQLFVCFFKVIRTLLDKDAGNNVSKSIDFVVNNTMTCDPTQISNSFNNYFISVGSTLANNIHSTVNPLLYVDSNVNSIIMPEMSEEEITSVILSINNSAPGYDDMPASVMKKCVYDYITPLT